VLLRAGEVIDSSNVSSWSRLKARSKMASDAREAPIY